MHTIRINRAKRLADEPHSGHNRYHPDITPVLEVAEGEEVILETRDALDGQLAPDATVADLASVEANLVHPLTGPVLVKGAKPGDMLEIEFVDIIPQPTAFSAIVPGLGFLRDLMTTPFVVNWKIRDGWATASEIPGVRIPGAPFMGISAVAPSVQKLKEWTEREQRALDAGGFVLPPDEAGAVPSGRCGLEGLRTLPPRENGGNFDVKQLTRGAKLLLRVFVEGALFSTGDAHFAQGDGEVCVTAVEMGSTAAIRFKIHKDLAKKRTFAGPVFSHSGYFADPRNSVPENFLGVMGMPINAKGEIEARFDPRSPQCGPQHDDLTAGARLQPRASIHYMQRCRRSSRVQCCRCAKLRRVSTFARAYFRRKLIALLLGGKAIPPDGTSTKWLDLLKEITPGITRVAVIRDPTVPFTNGQLGAIQSAAPSFRVEVRPLGARGASEIERGIAAFASGSNGGLIVLGTTVTFANRNLIFTLPPKLDCPRSTLVATTSPMAALCPTAPTGPTNTVARLATSTAFSKARSQPIYQCKRPRNTSLSSISRPRRLLASTCHRNYSPAPTR